MLSVALHVALQMDEIEHRQLLERGTVSLPALRDFRQELHKGAAWQPDSMRASGAGDLASWRRPGAAASEETPVGGCNSDLPVWATQCCIRFTHTQARPCGLIEADDDSTQRTQVCPLMQGLAHAGLHPKPQQGQQPGAGRSASRLIPGQPHQRICTCEGPASCAGAALATLSGLSQAS